MAEIALRDAQRAAFEEAADHILTMGYGVRDDWNDAIDAAVSWLRSRAEEG